MYRLRYQGLTYFAKRIREPMDSTYKDLQTVEVKMKLSANHYVKLKQYTSIFLIKIKKKIKTSIFYAHWITEKEIK